MTVLYRHCEDCHPAIGTVFIAAGMSMCKVYIQYICVYGTHTVCMVFMYVTCVCTACSICTEVYVYIYIYILHIIYEMHVHEYI